MFAITPPSEALLPRLGILSKRGDGMSCGVVSLFSIASSLSDDFPMESSLLNNLDLDPVFLFNDGDGLRSRFNFLFSSKVAGFVSILPLLALDGIGAPDRVLRIILRKCSMSYLTIKTVQFAI